MSQYYLAVDIGTSSGRHMLACIRDEKNWKKFIVSKIE